LRALALVGALTALSLPVFAATQTASACAEPSCQIIVPIGGVPVDTYYSPISATSNGASFNETALAGQVAPIVVPGSLSISIADWRGNNQGLDVQVYSDGFSSSLANGYVIPATDLTVAGVNAVLTTCMGVGVVGCSSIGTAPGAIGAMLDAATNPVVAVACPDEAIGFGMYNVGVDMTLTLNGTDAEIFGSAPASWYTDFFVTINEGAGVNFGALGC
jgi:hypothetical protein